MNICSFRNLCNARHYAMQDTAQRDYQNKTLAIVLTNLHLERFASFTCFLLIIDLYFAIIKPLRF